MISQDTDLTKPNKSERSLSVSYKNVYTCDNFLSNIHNNIRANDERKRHG